MSRYLKLYKEMENNQSELFGRFKDIHSKFLNDHKKYQKEFDEVGAEVENVIQKYIDDLCRTSEGSRYGNYTQNLADMFRNVVREKLPEIDDIGIVYE